MKYRELLQLYKDGKLSEEERMKVEELLEREEAILDYLFEQEELFGNSEEATIDREEAVDLNKEQEMEKQFQQQLQRSIRNTFRKMGMKIGAVLLVFILFIEFALPHVVDMFYYNPGKKVAEKDGWETEQMSLDLAVYSELFLPEFQRDNVEVVERGYGNYDIRIIQNVAKKGSPFVDIGGRIERGYLTVYDPNVLKRPFDNSFEWTMNSLDTTKSLEENIAEPKELPNGNREISHMSAGGTPEQCRERIKQLDEDRYYTAYVTMNRVMPYEEFYQFFNEHDIHVDWCATQVSDPVYSRIMGFSAAPSGVQLSWDEATYPLLQERKEFETEENARIHFTSMLRYMSEQKRFVKMMDANMDIEMLEKAVTFVEENGINVYGAVITTDKQSLQKLDDTAEVYSIYVSNDQ